MKAKTQHVLNESIRKQKIKIVGENLNGLILNLDQALNKANELGMDLVLMKELNDIAICKIMNYEKYLYELSKNKNNKVLNIKEIKIGPNTSDNDLSYRINHIKEFLNKGHKVKISMQFKGREMAYLDKSTQLMLKMIVDLETSGLPEMMPKMEGKKLFCVIKPIKK
jgi:translation initiation factor IF-3